MTEPSFRLIFLGGLPGLLRESVLPLGAFVVGSKLGGLALGIGASVAVSGIVYLHERRAGRDALLVRLALAFVTVQALVGLAAHSATVYLAQPVLASAAWGIAFLASAAVRRPLAGALACAWYPFPRSLRASDRFKRVFAIESVVWGLYLLARSALRLAVLLTTSIGGLLVVVFLTGAPAMVVLVAWSIHYAVDHLAPDEGRAIRLPNIDKLVSRF
jgi:hypothetical protein